MAPSRPIGPRVVITGMGAITNLGPDAPSTWSAMREGRSGISRIESPEFNNYSTRFGEDVWSTKIAGQVKHWDPNKYVDGREQRRLDRFAVLALCAAGEAVSDSGIDFSKETPERCGAVVGSGVGGIITIEEGVGIMHAKGPDRLSPFTVPRLMVNAAAGNISIKYGLQGPSGAHATACASSGHAIGDALFLLRKGRADVMLAGGAEAAVSPLCIGAFMTMRALSQRNDDPTGASRPFDRTRDGFVLAEGAAMFVIETEQHAKARGARIYAELLGYGNSSDAAHITAPDEQGRGATRSMKWALEDAHLNASDIGYVNAHGTSTPRGDEAEVNAVLKVFGDHARASTGGKLMMSSTKSMIGHCLGASGAVETIACVHAVRDGVIAPTINLKTPDEGFDIDLVPGHARERAVKYAMNNTFGFGGHNVTLLLGRYEG